jgi:hypothetical protein
LVVPYGHAVRRYFARFAAWSTDPQSAAPRRRARSPLTILDTLFAHVFWPIPDACLAPLGHVDFSRRLFLAHLRKFFVRYTEMCNQIVNRRRPHFSPSFFGHAFSALQS